MLDKWDELVLFQINFNNIYLMSYLLEEPFLFNRHLWYYLPYNFHEVKIVYIFI